MKHIILIIFGLFIISLSSANAQFQPIDAAYDPANSIVNNNEPSIAVNPTNNQNIIVATNYRKAQLVNGNTVYFPGQAKIGLYCTNNSGSSWNSILLSGNINYSKYADPSVAFRTDGTAFCSYLGINDALGEDQKSTLYVDKITGLEEGSLTVTHNIIPSLETRTHDKPYIHIDRNSTGIYRDRVYVSYSENDQLGADNTNKLMFTYLNETTGGFVNPLPINIPAEAYHVSGSVPCTDKQGNLYVAFYAEDIQTHSPSIRMVKSTNGGGAFFKLPDPAAGIQRIGDPKDGLLSVNEKKFRVKNFPSIAIDGSNGQYQNKIYVVYADNVNHIIPEEPDKYMAEIKLVKSSDGGNSWSNPVIISKNINAENFFPWISVNDNGIISVVYYELSGSSIIPKFLMSDDGGSTFLDAGISDSFNLDGCNINNFIGDYIGVAATQDKAVAAWTSTKAFLGQKPEICKMAIVPYEFPVMIKNDMPANISSNMKIDGTTYALPPSGLTLQLSPFVSHTFEVIDEVYPLPEGYYKFRNWNDENYNKITQVAAYSLTYGKSFIANYKLAFPVKITSYLEGGNGMESSVKWISQNYTHDYPVASGLIFYAFKYDATMQDKYSISVPNLMDNFLKTSWKFLYWNDGSTDPQKLNLQISGPLDFTAYYKGNLRSNNSTSFINSSQRKFIRTPDGSLHMVYESMGYVWYERSTDDGTSWQLMNDGKPLSSTTANSPSITTITWAG